MYTLKTGYFTRAGKVFGIYEYLNGKTNKWVKPKTSVGTEKEPMNDKILNEFIEKYVPEEICFLLRDKRGELRHIDVTLLDLEEK